MFFFLIFGIAIACFYLYSTHSDEIVRLTTGLLSLFCFLLSLFWTPWFVKIIAMIAILLLLPRSQRNAI